MTRTNPDEHALLCRLFAPEVTNLHMKESTRDLQSGRDRQGGGGSESGKGSEERNRIDMK